MNVLKHLTEMFEGSDEWKELCELQYRPAELAPGPERDAACTRLAEILEAHADRMERSGLVRWLASSFTPDGLRADAAVWREGRDPYA